MADALAHQAASQVVLTGRSGRAGASSSLRGLCGRRGGGPSVVLVRCDASASDERAACFGTAARVEAQPGCGRLGGVLHAAGVLADRAIPGQDVGHMRRVFAPKIPAMAGVGEALVLQGADKSIAFSSISALVGFPKHMNYGFANAALDSWYSCSKSRGVPGHAVQWGVWAAVGMAVKSSAGRESSDVGVLPPLQGLSALGHVTRSVPCAVICANSPSYWPALLRLMPRPSAFYGKLAAFAKAPRIQAQS